MNVVKVLEKLKKNDGELSRPVFGNEASAKKGEGKGRRGVDTQLIIERLIGGEAAVAAAVDKWQTF